MPNVRKTKGTARRPRRNTRRPKRSVPRSINALVSKAINRNMETKFSSNQYTYTGFNSSINSSGDFIVCLPNVNQGTAQNNRIGSSIKPVKLVIRGYYVYRADSWNGARMLGTRLFCFSDKTVSSYPVLTSAGANYQLLDAGGSPLTYTGTAMNYITPHNKDAFRWYADKRKTILKPYGYTNSLSPSSSNEITGMDKSMFVPFTITIPASKMPSVLKYDESISSSVPVNFAPLLALGYSDLLNFPADTVVQQLGMNFIATLYFKDA